tara:strand:- start:715 stop:900 length:186 start_codon:yes stop_codon:yes gene_type:complete
MKESLFCKMLVHMRSLAMLLKLGETMILLVKCMTLLHIASLSLGISLSVKNDVKRKTLDVF